MSVSSADRVRPIIPVGAPRTPRATLMTAFEGDDWTARRIAGHLVQAHADIYGTRSLQFVYGDMSRLEGAIVGKLSQTFDHTFNNVLVLTVTSVSVSTYRDRSRESVPDLDEQTWIVDFVLVDSAATGSGQAVDVRLTGYVRAS